MFEARGGATSFIAPSEPPAEAYGQIVRTKYLWCFAVETITRCLSSASVVVFVVLTLRGEN